MAEIRSLAGTVKNTQQSFPHLHQRHEAIGKELTKLRKNLLTDTRETARKDYFRIAPILEVNRQIKQLLVENYDEDKLLTRRIQVMKDMVALLGLCEPSRRGKRVDWKFDDETDELPDQSEKPSPSEEDNLDCPIDVCIICYGASRHSASTPPPSLSPKRSQ
ncbi:hypothetical protein BDV26DRAFT_286908 [Aspergillus bertholletiae]|uniref:Uncharacterized protein n=1 Tax=Aspergillus bertholletiae TaxID=1226010 RepID=A0A5N7AN54_9EURO|nr:hypothetical protein BDV26DRAFT_286908 [Aspergillus bertholletiae]